MGSELKHASLYVGAEELADALQKVEGYLLNAKIDLETGRTKRSAINTIEDGLLIIRAALSKAGGRDAG